MEVPPDGILVGEDGVARCFWGGGSSDGSMKSVSTSVERAILNSGYASPERPGAVSTMFCVRRPQPSATKYSSQGAITSAAVLPGA